MGITKVKKSGTAAQDAKGGIPWRAVPVIGGHAVFRQVSMMRDLDKTGLNPALILPKFSAAHKNFRQTSSRAAFLAGAFQSRPMAPAIFCWIKGLFSGSSA